MRLAAVVILTALAIAQIAAAQSPATPAAAPSEQIKIAATVVDVRETDEMRTDLTLLWNKDLRSRPIGHGVLTCTKVGTGGILGGGLLSCSGTYQLPLGKIAVQGILHGYNRYTLVITGGTARYKDASGTLFVRRVADGVRRLTFTL
jgi:hypothetical protein